MLVWYPVSLALSLVHKETLGTRLFPRMEGVVKLISGLVYGFRDTGYLPF